MSVKRTLKFFLFIEQRGSLQVCALVLDKSQHFPIYFTVHPPPGEFGHLPTSPCGACAIQPSGPVLINVRSLANQRDTLWDAPSLSNHCSACKNYLWSEGYPKNRSCQAAVWEQQAGFPFLTEPNEQLCAQQLLLHLTFSYEMF